MVCAVRLTDSAPVFVDPEDTDPLSRLLLHSVTLCVFLAWTFDPLSSSSASSVGSGSAGGDPHVSTPLSERSRMALTLAYGLCGTIIRNCFDVGGSPRWLAAVCTFTEWLRHQPRFSSAVVRCIALM